MTTADVESLYRLSFAQQGLLYHSLADPVSAFYVDQVVYTVDGPLDVGAFTDAWRQAMTRHAVLRTSFHWRGLDDFVQVVHAEADLPIRVYDWTGSPSGRFQQFLAEDRKQEFDLDRPPLWRLTLVRTGPDRHRFVFRYHHVLLDAWSALMLLDEVFTHYPRLAAGVHLPVVEPARTYRDYVAWLHSQDMTAAEEYWREALRGFTEPTPLPATRTAPPDGRENPEQRLELPADVAEGLRTLGRDHRVTLNSVMQAIWAVVLRQPDTGDVVFGTTVTNRPAELDGIQETLGLFINTVPSRVRASGKDTFLDCCRRIQRDLTERRRYDHSPLADVQGWSEVPGGRRLFETIMTFLNVPGIEYLDGRGRVGDLVVSDGDYRYRTNYPLSIMVIPGAGISLRMGYDPKRVDDEAVRGLLGRIESVARAVATAPEIRIADIPLLTADEQQTMLRDWNDTALETSDAHSLHELFARQAAATPDATALAYHDERITYRELDEKANQLANHLTGQGVQLDDRVGLCLTRGPELIVAMLGIMKAGGGYVPLDPAYPDERLAYMAGDAQLRVLVTERDLRDRLPRGGWRTVLVDAHHRTISRQSTEAPQVGVTPDNLAYVIYTSGSTGKPKGTMVAHRGLVNLAAAQRARFGTTPGDRVLQWASASFDASAFEIVMALTAGATLLLADQQELAPGPGLARLLGGARITMLVIPPSALAAVAPEPLPDLRMLVVAGEALPASLVERWAGRTVSNAYGPTETTVWVSSHECQAGPDDPLIGTPIGNTQVYVLDAGLRPVPVGVAGELYVGGPTLARGYLGRAALSSARFVANPFGGKGSRLYRTGDVVRWTGSGELEFRGRRDSQIKLRGVRIETGEIESVLRRHPSVADAAVVVAEPDDPRLVAYCVLGKGVERDEEALRGFLGRLLPGNLVPAAFLFVDAIPLTANGKRDLSALPSLAEYDQGADDGYIAPRTPGEELLAEIWAGVLGTDRIGVTDDFFRLGGNSIKGTLLTSRIQRACDVELPLRTLMKLRTIENCAAELEQALARQLAERGEQ
jgi:amino acid adenylation domain-containing protein